ncbi:hypothetical protein SAY87_014991 [Trapa incisa]|uniref:Protein kinase domain-containing protein n=1 Tax=Trapa incisa TaxID=236973 RepID=A0AAN7JLL6_9MYRT|nr:hypothetical protein SAY87_014991 [Trapa incisa]
MSRFPPVCTRLVIVFLCTVIRSLPLSEGDSPPPLPSPSTKTCGSFQIPFPFSSATSAGGLLFHAFNVSCTANSTVPFLHIGTTSYRILEFFPDGVLVSFPAGTCHQYNDPSSFGFSSNDYLAISVDNIVGLYDCEDSSLCKASCETVDLPGCSGSAAVPPACCYPLSDGSSWRIGEGFSEFSKYGCRGISSWVVPRGSTSGRQGVKLEWAIPRNSSSSACAINAIGVNATAVREGVRCACEDGLDGDGFAAGVGCLKSCIKDGQATLGKACYTKPHNGRKYQVLAGILALAIVVISTVALFRLITSRPAKPCSRFCKVLAFHKNGTTRMFSYSELQKAATRGGSKSDGGELQREPMISRGVLDDGSHVLVHKVPYRTDYDLELVLARVRALATVDHRHVARILECYVEQDCPLLTVYDIPTNRCLDEYLRRGDPDRIRLDWGTRMSIMVDIAKTLVFLRCQISPPITHNKIGSCYVLLDENFSVKIFGFEWIGIVGLSGSDQVSDVYSLGLLLLEMISGSADQDSHSNPTVTVDRIRNGRLEEMVDPVLQYHEKLPACREQIKAVADIATRCLLYGSDGRLNMEDVAKELVHITGDDRHEWASDRGDILQL